MVRAQAALFWIAGQLLMNFCFGPRRRVDCRARIPKETESAVQCQYASASPFGAKLIRAFLSDDIFQNLHGQIGKTGLVKVLNQLAADGSISLKAYGKQQVFVARQVRFPCRVMMTPRLTGIPGRDGRAVAGRD